MVRKSSTNVAPPVLDAGLYSILHHGDGMETFLELFKDLPGIVNSTMLELKEVEDQSLLLMREIKHEQHEYFETAKANYIAATTSKELENIWPENGMDGPMQKRRRLTELHAKKDELITKAYDELDKAANRLNAEIKTIQEDVRNSTGELPVSLILPVEQETTGDEPLYCHCRRMQFGDMVSCDSNDCEHEWFHLPCVGLTQNPLPDVKWYCPQCTKLLGLGKEEEKEDGVTANAETEKVEETEEEEGGLMELISCYKDED